MNDKDKELVEGQNRFNTETEQSYRDKIATIDNKGKRVWVYPRKPRGKFHRWRLLVGYVLLALLFIVPFIKIDGQPFFMLNFIERKFSIFGIVFWPQDLYILALSFLAFVIFIVLFTAAFGRIFCGWICPQTVFLELVYRKIEFWIEGDGPKQRKLNNAPLSFEKVFKKTLKHSIFFAIAFVIGNTLLTYIIGADKYFEIISEPVSAHLAGFVAVMAFSFIFYGIFAWFRENACIYVCPYGRLQSVLIDKNTIVVAYDHKRGEPRSKLSKRNENSGDCVDCKACVNVCPTGIDIRNGTQLECVNCTACIDACNMVMDKIKKPRKLIKYASLNQIDSGDKFRITPRLIMYTVVLSILILIIGFLVTGLTRTETKVLKAKGTIYQKNIEGWVTNLYTSTIINKTADTLKIKMKFTDDTKARIKYVGRDKLILMPEKMLDLTFFIEVPPKEITSYSKRFKINLIDQNGEVLETIKVPFVGPTYRGSK